MYLSVYVNLLERGRGEGGGVGERWLGLGMTNDITLMCLKTVTRIGWSRFLLATSLLNSGILTAETKMGEKEILEGQKGDNFL